MEAKPESLAAGGAAAPDGSDYAVQTIKHLAALSSSLERLKFLQAKSQPTLPSEQLRKKSLHQITDYILARVENLHAPLLIVVGGSTGAGKSTLVNSLLGETISPSGAVRPTTRMPVLAYNPADESWFASQRILTALKRLKFSGVKTDGALSTEPAVQLAPHPKIPQGIAMIDAPDVDSISDENRALAVQLLNAADLWLFVTTANRYADALPWDLLTEAGARDITVNIVLNRVPAGAEVEILPDLERLLAERNLGSSAVHVIHETVLGQDRLLVPELVDPISNWLISLAGDAKERRRIAAQTLDGALKRTLADVNELYAEVQDQEVQLNELMLAVDQRFDGAMDEVKLALKDGSLLRGEILARWQDFVGAGELLRGLEGRVGRIRDRIGSFFSGKPPSSHRVEEAIQAGLHSIFVAEITSAVQDLDRSWRNTPIGLELRSELPAPRPSEDLDVQASTAVREWQKDVLSMIREEGAGKRKTARMAAFGVNGIAVILMIVVFASTAGLTGLELGIAGGSAVIGQKLLEAIFGEDAVRRMATKANGMLEERARALIESNAEPYRMAIRHHQQPDEVQSLAEFIRSQGGKGVTNE
ncbi:dynamin family protein [Glutamicibacter sp. NPDC087344]|uniref:dynamin family protein n=1 Tax=Glutamicibacter sp. NPDC087344 TaxID=3363994 RepID=UPI00380213FD